MPSCASTISAFFSRFSAKTSSCRMVGLSSTMRMRCRSMERPPPPCGGRSLREQVDEALDGVQLALGQPVELRREDRGRRMSAQQREQLVVEWREALLLLQQGVDCDRTDRTVLEAQPDADQRLTRPGRRSGVGAVGLAALERLPDRAFAD